MPGGGEEGTWVGRVEMSAKIYWTMENVWMVNMRIAQRNHRDALSFMVLVWGWLSFELGMVL